MRVTLTVLLGLSAVASADDLHFKDGRVLSGRVTKESGRYAVVDRDRKHAVPESEVDRVEKKPCFMDEYESRLASVSKTDADALYGFGAWLQENAWAGRARVVFEQVIELDPDHRDARRALGYRLYEGAWVSPDELKRREGLVEFEGHWYTAHDLRVIQKEIEANEEFREALRQQRAITEKLGEMLPKFATFEKKKRSEAYSEMLRYADEINSPLLRKFADDTRAYYDGMATALCRRMKTKAQVSLTETELARPIPAIETSLGGIERIQPLLFGRTLTLVPEQVPVNIQLPQIDIYQTQTSVEIPSDCD
jgi:hypothetical protein